MKQLFSDRFKHRLLLASVLFGMLFGAGNLIFPIYLGQLSGHNIEKASIAFMLTSILLPILGVVYCAQSQSSDLDHLLEPFGKKYAQFFTILLLLTIGPLLALPRTSTVPYEVGIKLLLPSINHTLGLIIYSGLFFTVSLALALKPNKIKEAIGKVINPIFLICLLVFFIAFFLNPMGSTSQIEPVSTFVDHTFSSAFSMGYQTMDLLAVLVFTFVVISVNTNNKSDSLKDQTMDLVFAGVLSGALLMVIYYILAKIGASSRHVFEVSANGGIALGQIFNYYFGSVATLFLVLTITLACIKTATGLIIACANYFSKISSLKYSQVAIITALISFLVSNIGLDAIILFAAPVLSFLYPLAIMHVIYGFIFKNKNQRLNNFVLYSTMIGAFFEFLNDLPFLNGNVALVDNMLKVYHSLPLDNFGFAWLTFTVLGLVIGLIIDTVSKNVKMV